MPCIILVTTIDMNKSNFEVYQGKGIDI